MLKTEKNSGVTPGDLPYSAVAPSDDGRLFPRYGNADGGEGRVLVVPVMKIRGGDEHSDRGPSHKRAFSRTCTKLPPYDSVRIAIR